MNIASRPRTVVRALVAASMAALATAAAPALASDYRIVASIDEPVGRYTDAGLAIGADGFEYGITGAGGAGDKGTIFRVEADGRLTPIFAFAADGSQGWGENQSTLLAADDGWLYGIQTRGGVNDGGVLFRISLGGTFELLHEFGGDINRGAGAPHTALAQDAQGRIYGGLNDAPGRARFGAVFMRDVDGTVKIAHTFRNDGDGAFAAAFSRGPDGRVYGTTSQAGADPGGTLFVIGADAGLHTLRTFDGATEGCDSRGPLAFDAHHVFGALGNCGLHHGGSLWKASLNGRDFELLRSFRDGDKLGFIPNGVRRRDDGRLFSVNWGGGELGGGTVFMLTEHGSGNVLNAFTRNGPGATYPVEAPVLRADGRLRATTMAGGSGGGGVGTGTVYEVTP